MQDNTENNNPKESQNPLLPPKDSSDELNSIEGLSTKDLPQEETTSSSWQDSFGSTIRSLSGMYRNWFLDYASYVILERAIPHIEDGLKPVQRRVLFAMNLLENGHLHKVAKIVGQTMAFHPHGDASINDALVQLGQKGLLIDTQGNWGNIFTGDDAAAGRYIEAKLSPFALETVFDSKITTMKKSYDGTADEPESLPVRFPLLLAQGAEGIAVGLSSKIYPHNPKELLESAIAYLRGESFELYPDFKTGGLLDVERYNDGMRGGALKCRAKIERIGDRTLSITELPYGKTTTTLIESILKANEKGQIKIRHIDDMTAAEVDIRIQLPTGVSTDKTIDGLYAFTDCEVSLAPNACVIRDDKPIFLGVSDLLRYNVDRTRDYIKAQLSYRLDTLKENHLHASLERIFIERRIYKDKAFEEASNETNAINYIRNKIESLQDIIFIIPPKREDYKRLLELKMARILRFNIEKHEKMIARLEKEIAELDENLRNLTSYTIRYYEHLLQDYFLNEERKTTLCRFSSIEATKVIEANEKLYFDKEGGFAGTAIKGEFIDNCSLLDDLIVFFRDGTYFITKIEEKKFLGKGNIIHIARFVRNDKRTIYNLIYRDGASGPHYIKRFFVTGVTRDRVYNVTTGKKGSAVVYFSANPNGEAEIVRISLKPRLRLRNLSFEKDFSEVVIRGRASKGNLVTKVPVQRIVLKERGASTLGNREVWFDPDVLRINFDGQGVSLGALDANTSMLVMRKDGSYYTAEVTESAHFSPETCRVEGFDPVKVWTLIYRNGENGAIYLKRFTLSEQSKPQLLQGDGNDFIALSDHPAPLFDIVFKRGALGKLTEHIDATDFVGVKSVNAKGKRVSTLELDEVKEVSPDLLQNEDNTTEQNNEQTDLE